MRQVALGIDIGTGSAKAGLVDVDGRLLAIGRSAHRNDEPRPGWSETDPARWMASAREAIAVALHQQPDAQITAVGLSGQMHGVVLCDDVGTPVRPAVLWPDRRAGPLLARVAPDLASHLDVLGNPLVPGMAGPILAALVVDEPAVSAAARWALQPKDWFRLQLTGEVATDPSDASATLLWSVETDEWDLRMAELLGVRTELLAPVLPSDAVAGSILATSAATLGLPTGIPVVVGAADTAAALLGAGVQVGETQLSVGTGGQIASLLEVPRVDPSRRTHLYRSATDGGWYAMAAIQNAGLAIDWALRVLGADLDEAAAAVAATPPGAGGVTFLPYLTGERTPHLAPDLTASWVGLHQGADRSSLLRAVFEGVAFALRDGLDAIRDAGHTVDQALLAGGGSTAGWWQQLLTDALGIPLVPHDAADASVRGAALLAWSATGRRSEVPVDVVRGAATVPDGRDLEVPRKRFCQHAAEALGTP